MWFLNRPELTRFEHDGKRYAMTEEEIEAAYRYKQRQLRLADAREQVDFYVYGGIDVDEWDDDEKAEAESRFEEDNGILVAVVYAMLDDIIAQFERFSSPGIKEDDAWDAAIEAVINNVKEAEI